MPRLAISTDNKKTTETYPKLTLDQGEQARIACIEVDPLYEYTHTLRVLQLDQDDNVKMIKKQIFNREVEVPDTKFVGKHICIGAIDVIAKRGADPDGCPVCAAAMESDAVDKPERRFAMHIAKYVLRPNTFEVAEPYSVQVLGWSYGDAIYNKLADFRAEWKSLQRHDLLLGPCENKTYQRFEIRVAARAEWLLSEQRKQLTIDTFKQNGSTDLTVLIGRRLGRPLIEQDLQLVLDVHRRAYRPHGVPQIPAPTPDVEAPVGVAVLAAVSPEEDLASLDDLLVSTPAVEPDSIPAPQSDDLVIEPDTTAVEDSGDLDLDLTPTPAAAKKPAEADVDLEDLLDGLV